MHGQVETFLKHSEHVRSDFSYSIMDSSSNFQSHLTNEGIETGYELELSQSVIESGAQNSSKLVVPDNRESTLQHSVDNGLKSPLSSRQSTDGEAELVEQFEPGVYITFIQLKNDIKIFKRVRFRYAFFALETMQHYLSMSQKAHIHLVIVLEKILFNSCILISKQFFLSFILQLSW